MAMHFLPGDDPDHEATPSCPCQPTTHPGMRVYIHHRTGSDMQPTIGRIVHYTLSEQDVKIIDQRVAAGTDSHNRNPVSVGQVYPAQVTAVFGSGSTANLVVQLDGTAQYWATSRTEGEGDGHWAWPPRV